MGLSLSVYHDAIMVEVSFDCTNELTKVSLVWAGRNQRAYLKGAQSGVALWPGSGAQSVHNSPLLQSEEKKAGLPKDKGLMF